MNENGQNKFEIFRQGEEDVMYGHLGQVGRTAERSDGTGMSVSRHKAGDTSID